MVLFYTKCHLESRVIRLNYAQERRSGLEVFLDDPAVAIDTNHLYADNRFMPTLRPKSLTDRVASVGSSA